MKNRCSQIHPSAQLQKHTQLLTSESILQISPLVAKMAIYKSHIYPTRRTDHSAKESSCILSASESKVNWVLWTCYKLQAILARDHFRSGHNWHLSLTIVDMGLENWVQASFAGLYSGFRITVLKGLNIQLGSLQPEFLPWMYVEWQSYKV